MKEIRIEKARRGMPVLLLTILAYILSIALLIVGIIMVPMGLQMGFSVPAISMLICAAAVLGDAGSPASDQALLPTATLNLDGQHDHIWDTCVPSFICCNVPIIVLGTICACIM